MILQYVTKPGNVFFLFITKNVSVNDSYILDTIGLVSLKTFVNKKKITPNLQKPVNLKKNQG